MFSYLSVLKNLFLQLNVLVANMHGKYSPSFHFQSTRVKEQIHVKFSFDYRSYILSPQQLTQPLLHCWCYHCRTNMWEVLSWERRADRRQTQTGASTHRHTHTHTHCRRQQNRRVMMLLEIALTLVEDRRVEECVCLFDVQPFSWEFCGAVHSSAAAPSSGNVGLL